MGKQISDRSIRYLQAHKTGDHWKGKTVPRIRLQGKWLAAAGIGPGDQVAVEIIGKGQLLIRKLEERT